MSQDSQDAEDPIVCFCNEVRLGTIVDALAEGACTMADIYDRTFAGCGPCGGSCQPDLALILQDWLAGEETSASGQDPRPLQARGESG